MIKLTSIFILSLLIISCDTNSSHHNKNSFKDKIIIDITKDSLVKLASNVIVPKRFIILSGNENLFFEQIDKVVLWNEYYLIFDDSRDILSLFDKKGVFKYNIGRLGAENEYSDISDFVVDKKRGLILILSVVDRAIYEYTYNGELIRKIEFPFQPQLLSIDSTYNFIVFYMANLDAENFNLRITDRNIDKIVYSGFSYPEGQYLDLTEFTGNILSNSEGFLYTNSISSQIYQVYADGCSYVKYEIILKEPNFKETQQHDFIGFITGISKGQLNFLSNRYIENNDFLIFAYNSQTTDSTISLKNAFFNKRSRQVFTTENIQNSFLNSTLPCPVGLTEEGDFISILNPVTKEYTSAVNDKLFLEELQRYDLVEKLYNENDQPNYILTVFNLEF